MKLRTKVVIAGILVIVYRSYSDIRLERISNPYNGSKINLNELSYCEANETVKEFLTEMEKYELLSQDEYIDMTEINNIVKDIISSNKYTDISSVANKIAMTKVEFDDIDGERISGHTIKIYNRRNDDLMEQKIVIESNDIDTYIHETIHGIYPAINNSDFFEEAITSVMSSEYNNEDYKAYEIQQALLKMFMEVVDVDVIKETRATGLLSPIISKLESIGLTEDDAVEFIVDLEKFQSYYKMDQDDTIFTSEASSNELEKFKELCPEVFETDTIDFDFIRRGLYEKINKVINNIANIYEMKYSRLMFDNIIMQSYINKIQRVVGNDVEYKMDYSKPYFSEYKKNEYVEDIVITYLYHSSRLTSIHVIDSEDKNISIEKESINCK